jgi:hypothetical protein
MPETSPLATNNQVAWAYSGDPPRPILSVSLTGLNEHAVTVLGLLDSGATHSGLPLEYAFRLGYGADDLRESVTVLGDGTEVASFEAQQPVTAMIQGRTGPLLLFPAFMRGDHTVWGRDLMAKVWRVTFCEREKWFHFAYSEPAADHDAQVTLVPETVSRDAETEP